MGPSLIPKSHPLATVKGVNNALLIEADPLGEIMLYGPGAGSGPTAASVVSDILNLHAACLLYTSPSPRDLSTSRMPSSA